MKFDELIALLHEEEYVLQTGVNLREYSYAKTGGVAELIVYPRSTDELQSLLKIFQDTSYKIIGATTNLLFLDDTSYGAFISLKEMKGISYDSTKKQFSVEAGCQLDEFVLFAADRSLKGFENLIGIPGTLGGAVYMNAGAFRCEIKDQLVSVQFIDGDGNLRELEKDKLKMNQRYSIFHEQPDWIITQATFKREEGDYKEINDELNRWQSWRDTYLEGDFPNLGSIFATKDLYADMARHYPLYRVLLKFVRNVIYRNSKQIDNRILNAVTAFYFGWFWKKYPYSPKTLNTFINTGLHTNHILSYIDTLKVLTKDLVRLENEVVKAFEKKS